MNNLVDEFINHCKIDGYDLFRENAFLFDYSPLKYGSLKKYLDYVNDERGRNDKVIIEENYKGFSLLLNPSFRYLGYIYSDIDVGNIIVEMKYIDTTNSNDKPYFSLYVPKKIEIILKKVNSNIAGIF